eukprot:10560-Prymnesium_polylepis.1
MVSEVPPQLMRHKTLSKKYGPLLQVNATAYPIGGGKTLAIAKAYELEPISGDQASYEDLERAALLELGQPAALMQSHRRLYDSFRRLGRLALERTAHPVYPGAAMLMLDASVLAPLA